MYNESFFLNEKKKNTLNVKIINFFTIGLPAVVKNCTFNNQTQHSVEVQCTAGYDGGLPQVIIAKLKSFFGSLEKCYEKKI